MMLRRQVCRLANRAWMALNGGRHKQYTLACASVEQTQQEYLRRLLAANAATAFGRQHDFVRITSLEDFQRNVPLSLYEDHQPAIAAIAEGRQNILTRDPVTLFEPTSGSSSAPKHAWPDETDFHVPSEPPL